MVPPLKKLRNDRARPNQLIATTAGFVWRDRAVCRPPDLVGMGSSPAKLRISVKS
jgi:hypothetical protein